jgi:Flp pilus assembly protein TadD
LTPGEQALGRARGLVTIGRWREALEALGPAVGGEATMAQALCLQAQCLLALKEPAEAAVAARQALAVEPDNAWAHRLLAIAWLRTGRRQAALAEATESVRLVPEVVQGQHTLAVCLLSLRRTAEAEQVAMAAVAGHPEDPLAHLTLGRVAASRGDFVKAERAYREGLRLEPENADLAVGLAQLLHRLGRRHEAAEAYLAAGRSDPANTHVRSGLARLGLPAAGAGVIGAIKLGLVVGVPRLLPALTPARAGLIAAILLGLGCLASTALRIRGTRRLPEQVRRGLYGEHRNAALRWLSWAGVVSGFLAVWAALLPGRSGGGLAEAAAFAAFAVLAIAAVHYLHVGPRRNVIDVLKFAAGRFIPHRARSRFRRLTRHRTRVFRLIDLDTARPRAFRSGHADRQQAVVELGVDVVSVDPGRQ